MSIWIAGFFLSGELKHELDSRPYAGGVSTVNPTVGLNVTNAGANGQVLSATANAGELAFITPTAGTLTEITSGDGVNSFGANSIDVDKGGLKYGGRIDLLPLGKFKEGNDGYIADLKHEDKLKVLIGTAYSYNIGASSKVGEGHYISKPDAVKQVTNASNFAFTFYDSTGKEKHPDYRKWYGDILIKYKGFSFLGEYVSSSALSLEGTFINSTATVPLFMTEISNYLALGNGYNIQGGYVSKSGLSLDFKYEKLTKEFNKASSILSNQDAITVGITKYLKGNNLKIQSSVSTRNNEQFNATLNANEKIKTATVQLSFQVVF